MNNSKASKKNKPLVFSQDIPPYCHEMLVCVGATAKDAKNWIKKFGTKEAKKEYPMMIENYKDWFIKISKGEHKGVAIAELDKQYLMMILPKFKDTWNYWECIIHELSHILDWICKWKMLDGETEARAYLHEWLFREIRRKLQKIDKI